METDVREELQRFYIKAAAILDGAEDSADMPEESRPQKKCYGRKIAKTAYWMLIAGTFAYEALIGFGDKLKSETLKENILANN